jgi:tetratricopeptide (TPR) repeat protein
MREQTDHLGMVEASPMRRSHLRFMMMRWLLVMVAILAPPYHALGQNELGDAAAYHKRGIERRRQRDYDQAIADFDQAIRLNPAFAEAYLSRANARRDTGDYDRAITDYTEAIRLDPKSAAAYYSRGYCREARGDPTGAKADYAEAARLDPKLSNH